MDKSKGHLVFAGNYEFFIDIDNTFWNGKGELYSASIANPIDNRTGYRKGHLWQAHKRNVDSYMVRVMGATDWKRRGSDMESRKRTRVRKESSVRDVRRKSNRRSRLDEAYAYAYGDAGVCPECGDDGLSFFKTIDRRERVGYSWRCDNCSAKGIAWYLLVFDGHEVVKSGDK